MTRRIRYLTLLVLLLGSIGTWGQDPFNPSDPPEPGQPPMKLQVAVSPAEAGGVSGTGRFVEGASVSLRAYVNTGFRFVSWTNASGQVLSTSMSYSHTKGAGHEQLTANYLFDPSNPTEPVDPATIMYYQLQLNATEGGYVSGGGRYLANTQVTLNANAESKFDFIGWYDDASGDCLSTASYFYYTTTAKHRSITARFVFNPDSPNEPDEPVLRRTVTATATEGGTTNFSSQRVLIGSNISFSASKNSGYDFDGWYMNGVLYTKSSSFSYTVTDAYGQDFEARFVFNPSSPNDPSMPTTMRHSFYLMNKVTKPGATVKYPIYLSSVRLLKDMSFQLEFPEVLTPDFSSVEMSAKAIGYGISYNKVDAKNYVFTLSSGEVPAGNSALLMFTINVAEDIVTAQEYPVKINLVEVTEEDETVTTASTRNGRISVYKNGDANGDDNVNVGDVVEIVNSIMDTPSSYFIKEAADCNDDVEIDVGDIVEAVSIILNSDVTPAPSAARMMEKPTAELWLTEHIDNTLSLCLEKKGEYMAAQFDVRLDKGQTLNAVTLNESVVDSHLLAYQETGEGSYRIVVYSMDNAPFANGGEELLNLQVTGGNVVVENTYLVTTSLRIVACPAFSNTATGISSLSESIASSQSVYDLQGRRWKGQRMPKGVYVMNGKKIVVR